MKVPVRDIADDEVLTQYGVAGQPFRNAPRWETEDELSICATVHDTPGSARCVTGRERPDHDASRQTTAGTLRGAGFVVRHSPTHRNDHHASVGADRWDDEMTMAFDAAFEANGDSDA